MPLPWKLPTDEEARELYRRIDQIITDLYNLVRSILFGPHRPPLPQDNQREEDENVPDLLAHLGSTNPQSDSIVAAIPSCFRRRSRVAKAANEITKTNTLIYSLSIFFSVRLDFSCKRVSNVRRCKFGAFCTRQFHVMISLGW